MYFSVIDYVGFALNAKLVSEKVDCYFDTNGNSNAGIANDLLVQMDISMNQLQCIRADNNNAEVS